MYEVKAGVRLLGTHEAELSDDDLVLHRRSALPFHPNGMRFYAFDGADTGKTPARERTYLLVARFVVDELQH